MCYLHTESLSSCTVCLLLATRTHIPLSLSLFRSLAFLLQKVNRDYYEYILSRWYDTTLHRRSLLMYWVYLPFRLERVASRRVFIARFSFVFVKQVSGKWTRRPWRRNHVKFICLLAWTFGLVINPLRLFHSNRENPKYVWCYLPKYTYT